MSSGKVLLGVLAGVAVGATLGILFAPDKGSKTRKKIANKGTDFAEGIEDKFNEFKNMVTSKFNDLKSEAANVAENGKIKETDGAKAKA